MPTKFTRMDYHIYFGVLLIGLIHGLEPGHGWPVAVYYSIRNKNRIISGLLSSGIIAFFHLFSSIAVVIIFLMLNEKLSLTSFPIAKYIASITLVLLAAKAWLEKPQSLESKKTKNLWQIASYAMVLGFAHEEEFAILAFCIGGTSCLALMIAYASAVTFALITITLLSIKSYSLIELKIKKYEKYMGKIFAIILFLIGMSYLFRF